MVKNPERTPPKSNAEELMKKKLKVNGLTEKLVLEVFPDLYRKV